MRKKYNIEVLRIKEINKHTFLDKEKECAVIFCSSYENRLSRCKYAENWLIMEFDSVGENTFNKNHAELIFKFVNQLSPMIKTIYICTDRGESRGPAIAAALIRYFGYSDKYIWYNYQYHPDPIVYKTLCKTFGVFMPNYLIKYKTHLNNISFKKETVKRRK